MAIKLVGDRTEAGLASVDLVLDLLESLAGSPRPRGVSDVARDLASPRRAPTGICARWSSVATCARTPSTERYEIGVKMLALGEAVRDRFDVARRHAAGNGPPARSDRPGGDRLGPGRRAR